MPFGGYRSTAFTLHARWAEYIRDAARVVYSVINAFYTYDEVRQQSCYCPNRSPGRALALLSVTTLVIRRDATLRSARAANSAASARTCATAGTGSIWCTSCVCGCSWPLKSSAWSTPRVRVVRWSRGCQPLAQADLNLLDSACCMQPRANQTSSSWCSRTRCTARRRGVGITSAPRS